MRVPVIDAGTLSRNWWLFLLRGLAGLIFGIITFIAPGISLAALVLLFGAYALVDGVFALWSAIRRRGQDRWWVLLLQGILGIAAGVLTLTLPAISALALLYVIAAWALVTGALEIAAAIRLRKVIAREWLLVLSGIASIVLGVLLWIGAYALVTGALLVGLSFRLRSWGKAPRTGAPRAAPHVA